MSNKSKIMRRGILLVDLGDVTLWKSKWRSDTLLVWWKRNVVCELCSHSPLFYFELFRRHHFKQGEIYKNINEVKIMYEKEIELKIRELPDYLRREVLDYVNFLIKKYKGKEIMAKKFLFD